MTNVTDGDIHLKSARETALLLNIEPPTLRKYCLLLEKKDYNVFRNDKGHRYFSDRDLVVIRRILDTAKQPNTTLEQAVNIVIATIVAQDKTLIVPSNETQKDDDYIKKSDFDEYKAQQEAFQKELLARLDHQQKYIEERLQKRDNLLMESLKESTEMRKQIAEKNRGFLSRLFGK